MKITRNNYEQYFLDFIESRLNPTLQAEFEQFLDANPDLKKELEEFENLSVADSKELKFHKKPSLKKNFIAVGEINENNYENFLVAAIENDLNEQEKQNLKNFISENSFVEKEQTFFGKTILLPDEKIIFLNKEELKKTAVIRMNWQQAAIAIGIAASMLLLIYFNLKETAKREIAENNQTEKIKKNEKQDVLPIENNLKENLAAENITYASKEKMIRHKKQVTTGGTQLTTDSNHSTINSRQIAEKIAEEKIDIEKEVPIEIIAENKSENFISDTKGEENISNLQPQTSNIQSPTNNSFTLKEFLAFAFRKNVLKENVSNKKKETKITAVDLASAAVKVTSKIFGAKLKMKKQYGNNGELAAVSLSSPRFEISRTLHGK